MSMIKKLIKIQQELKAPKNQTNSFGKYKYRTVEGILELAKPILAKHDLAIFLSDELVLIGDRYYVKATATLSDGEHMHSVTAFARETLSKKGMDDSQVTGSTSSYSRKYALCGLLAIDSGEKDADDRGEEQVNEVKLSIESCETKDELTKLYKSLSPSAQKNNVLLSAFKLKTSELSKKDLKDRI